MRGKMPKSKQLNMDDYLKFVIFNLKHTIDRKALEEKRKKLQAVNVPFKIMK